MSLPIVGAKFRPPALAILQILPMGCPLEVRPEPGNAYDSNALQVIVKTSDIPEAAHEELGVRAAGFGKDLEEILAEPEHHLGYVPKELAAKLAPEFSGQSQFGVLKMTIQGQPGVSLPREEDQV